jgi:hypothetical protein
MEKFVRFNLIKFLASFFIICITSSTGISQTIFEAGISAGPSNFLGDLGGRLGKGRPFIKDNNFKMTRLLAGFYVTAQPNDYIGIRLAANFGRLEGADSIINDKGGWETARKNRNLHFRSPLTEAYLAFEVYPLVFLEEDPSDVWHKWRPYGLIGVGVFHFNPKSVYTDPSGNQTWVDLKPLRTEGQGMPNHPTRKEYNLTQLNIPYGVGIKYFLSERINISLELVNRKTFTDYIDDVSTKFIDPADFYNYFGASSVTAQIAEQVSNRASTTNRNDYQPGAQRGTTTNNDAYYATTIKLGYRFGADGSSRFTNQTRCPVMRF